MDDPFSILGARADASPAALRAAFRERAFSCHPDRNPDDPRAEERFKRLVAAYRMAALGLEPGPRAPEPDVGPPPPPSRERWVCPRCDDTFSVQAACFRCGDPLLDSWSLEQPPELAEDPRIADLVAALERPRPEPLFTPGPDLPFGVAAVFGLFGASVIDVGLVPVGVMLLAFGALVVGRELHARRSATQI